jgi:hypothetical protein
MATYTPTITFDLGMRMDPTTSETRVTMPVITLTQVKAAYQVDLTEVTGSR